MSQAHPLVYIARHGQTVLNASDSFRGNVDAPLDKTGWRQANKLKEYFKDMDFGAIFTSPKERASDTAKKLAEGTGLNPIEHPQLCALNVGDFSGQPKSPENLQALEHYIQNPDIAIPGGESLNDFKARIQPLIKDAVELALDSGKLILIVAHSSVIHEVGTMIGGHHEYTLVEPGGVACIYIQDGKLDAEPIFKPKQNVHGVRGETMT